MGINERGDIVEVHYDWTWNSVAVRWSARDGTVVEQLPFPGTWNWAAKVKEDGFVLGGYGSDTVLGNVAVLRLR